ncbi:MAG: DUF3352 domain-containing protein [Chloroflexota bacterium]
MKKLALLATLLILALGLFVLPAAAQTEDLTTFAGYLPADAAVYAGLRTDDMFIGTIDTLLTKLGGVIPGGMMSGSLQETLDQFATDIEPGGSFATTIRPWLGDTAAFGIYTLDPSISQPYTIVFSIKDQDLAEKPFDTILSTDDYSVKDGDGYTVYSPKSSLSRQPNYIFRSDVLIITSDKTLVESGGVMTSPLSDNPDFGAAVEMLPESQYNCVIYADTPKIIASAAEDNMNGSDKAGMEMFSSMLNAVKPMAFGLTILDDRSLTVDVVAPIDASASSALMMTTTPKPINPDFAQHILAGTPLVAQGTDLYDNYQNSIANLRALAATMPTDADMKPQDVETALWGLGFLVRGLTGEETSDALGWTTGDYAFTLGFAPSFTDAQSIFAVAQSMPLEFGLIVEATDADAAQKVYDGLTRSLSGFPDPRVTVKQETLDSGAEALSLTLQGPDMPFPIELLAATGNGVFAVGTRRTVEAALNPKNAGLSSDAAYIEASKYLLDDTNSALYLSGSGLKPLARVMTQSANPEELRQEGKQIQAVLDVISSASVSASVLPNGGGSMARLVWTLPE